jgi:hypothetical protein
LWAHGINPPYGQRPINREIPYSRSITESFFEELLNVRSCGFNGITYICSNNLLDTIKLLQLGHSIQDIVLTGNPALDQFIANPQPLPLIAKKNNDIAVLFVSTGYQKFNRLYLANIIYEKLFLCCTNIAGSKYKIYIRLKPGEKLTGLRKDYTKLLTGAGAVFLDNSQAIEEQIKKCDIILTEQSSVAITAALVGKPVVIIKTNTKYGVTPTDLVKFLFIDDPKDSIHVFDCATDKNYITFQCNLINDNEKLLFHKLDGQAHKRIANIIELVIKTHTNKKFSHPNTFLPEKIFTPYRQEYHNAQEGQYTNKCSSLKKNQKLFRTIFNVIKMALPFGLLVLGKRTISSQKLKQLVHFLDKNSRP